MESLGAAVEDYGAIVVVSPPELLVDSVVLGIEGGNDEGIGRSP